MLCLNDLTLEKPKVEAKVCHYSGPGSTPGVSHVESGNIGFWVNLQKAMSVT
jgi:hypothetical protein